MALFEVVFHLWKMMEEDFYFPGLPLTYLDLPWQFPGPGILKICVWKPKLKVKDVREEDI